MKTQGQQNAKLGESLSLAILVAVFFGNFAQQAFAKSGREDRLEGYKLLIHVDSRWVGCRMGGYLPIRISLLNSSSERTLRIRFDPRSEKLPTVEKKIRLPQNEKVFTTLAIPVVGSGQYGRLQFFEDNKLLDTLDSIIEFPEYDRKGFTQPACLIVSEQSVSLVEFQKSIRLYQTNSADSGIGARQENLPEIDMLRLPPAMLPTSWIGYSGVDIVLIPAEMLAKLDSATRQAILKWTQTGGTLVVYENGKTASESIEINRLLFSEADEISNDWRPVEFNFRDDGFVQKHRYTMGNVFVFRENPFPGTFTDWYPFMSELDPVGSRWFERMGLSARGSSGDFFSFVINGIKIVPVFDFLILITLFTILIGPLNYFVLWKRKKLFLLIATIPGIAFVTSLMLFGYSIFSNGLGVKTRIRSLTVLDQRTRSAVTSSRFALYAGMTPSGGLVFSNDTAVFPIWPDNREFDTALVKWGDRQNFDRGWIRSRTRTQFLTITHRKERGRLEVEKLDEKYLRVSNGFEFEISHIVVSDDDGNLFGGGDFEAGAQVNFSRVEDEFLERFLRKINAKEEKENPVPRYNRYERRSPSFYMGEPYYEMTIPFLKNKAERILKETAIQMKRNRRLSPRMYFAILKENPGVDIGVEDATEIRGFHLLIGYY